MNRPVQPTMRRQHARREAERVRREAERAIDQAIERARASPDEPVPFDKRAYDREYKARQRDEANRELLEELYDHPATARLLRLVNAGRWAPEENLGVWLAAADDIPADLRKFAFGVAIEWDPLWSVARVIASIGADSLEEIARLYGISRQAVQFAQEDGLRKLRDASVWRGTDAYDYVADCRAAEGSRRRPDGEDDSEAVRAAARLPVPAIVRDRSHKVAS